MRRYRRSIRLKRYDDSQAGAYFVTVCTQNRACLFGDVVDGEMRLNDAGRAAKQCWNDIPVHFPHVEWVIMPNHIHGIVVIADGRGTACRAPTERFGRPVSGSLPTVIRSFKSVVTKRINEIRNTPGAKLWQRNDYEPIIRNDNELHRIREYIAGKPVAMGNGP